MQVTVMLKFTSLHCTLGAFLLASIWCSVLALPAGDKSSPNEHVLSTENLSSRDINQNKSGVIISNPAPAVPHKSFQPQPSSAKNRLEHLDQPPVSPTLKSVPVSLSSTTSASSHHNISSVTSDGTIINNFPRVNSGALLRGFYVFVGLSVIVVMYLVVRSVRLRRKVSRVHKYGILASREDVEMTPLGAEDEDDDTIVFDLSSHPPP